MGQRNKPRTAVLVLTLFVVNALLLLAEYTVLYGYHRSITTVRVAPPDWIGVVRYGTFAGQLFTLSLVGALAEKRRWAMWLSVLPFVVLLTLCIMPEADRNWLRMLWYILDEFDRHAAFMSLQLLVLFYANSIAPLFMLLGGILLLSVVCWPIKVFLGWRFVEGLDRPPKSGRISTWQMLLWLGLWSALFFVYTQVRAYFGTDWLFAGWLAVPVVLFVGLPIAIFCSGPQFRWYAWLTIPACVLALSYAESELSFFVASRMPRGQTGIPLSYVICFNASIAGAVTGNLLIMRAFGLRLHMPLKLMPKPAPVRAATPS